MRNAGRIGVLLILASALGCQERRSSGPAEIVGASTASAIATAPPTTAPIPTAAPTTDPFGNPIAAAPVASNDPFAAVRGAALATLPAKLPRDRGGAKPLKITPMTLGFAQGRTANSTAELQADGTLLLDSKKSGKISANKVAITIPKHALTLTLRSDGYAVFSGVPALDAAFMKSDKDGVTSRAGNRLSVTKDGLSIVSIGAAGEFTLARLNPAITDDKLRTTALMIAEAEGGHTTESATAK